MPSSFELSVLESLKELKGSVGDILDTIHGNGEVGLKGHVAMLLADKAARDKESDRDHDGRTWFRRTVAGPVIGKIVLSLVALATVYAVKEIRGTRSEVQEIKVQQQNQATK